MPKKKVKPEDRPLTGKQTAFVDEYLVNGFNGGMAALKAGYCRNIIGKAQENNLAVIASQNLNKLNIKAEIARKREQTAEKLGITQEMVVDKVMLLANHCLGKLADKDNGGRVDSAGAARALEMLCKHVGAFEADNSQRDKSFKDIIQQLGRRAIQSRSVSLLPESDQSTIDTENVQPDASQDVNNQTGEE